MSMGWYLHPLAGDLDHILSHTKTIWQELSGRTIYITGGTGFFGTWLLESLVWANEVFDARTNAIVLTRNVEKFSKRYPHLVQHSRLRFVTGDARSVESPADEIDYVIHGAATVTTSSDPGGAAESVDTIVGGTRRMLALAHEKRVARFLFISSGAVYGTQPPNVSRMPEEYPGLTEPLAAGLYYAQAKRTGEALCASHYGLNQSLNR